MVQPLWKIVWHFITKVSVFLSCGPTIALLSVYSQELKAYVHKNLQTDEYNSFIHNCPNMKTTYSSGNTWIKNYAHIYTIVHYLVIQKKRAINLRKNMEEHNTCGYSQRY
jgi:hypothetical protein